ncbi:lysylphosphatidylglycerol synthase transmembrane domain-containing protein [Actinomadura macrotermitis]|uniref:Flippase-like domain-containing protein n=1 Tax=Actinomadura macrotermitis TaxID=2585200 RepID=A0A7K0BPQ8_9ACTN|nr:lysylphosphatidylglycerol synthase transmembrane domain-containing protein [Actinomadura macrotermitis]MQY02862.1 hypothetical protein [Actinomadura macrotermitis]
MTEVIQAPAHIPAPPAERPRRSRRGLIVQWALLAGVIATIPLLRDQLPDLGTVWTAARSADPTWLLLVVLAEAASMAAFARLQRRLLRAGGLRVSRRRAFAITYAGNALSTSLPAGPAVSVVFTFQQFRRSGATARLATAVIIVGGIVTSTAYTAIGLLALLADPYARGPALTALAGPAVAAAVLLLALRRPALRARITRPLRRLARAITAHPKVAPWAQRLREGMEVLRPTRRDWAMLAILASLNWLFDILALFAAASAVGIDVAPTGVTLAYFAAQAAGSLLPLLPGGIGAIESSMAAGLVAFGATLAPAGAAVGLYRLFSYWMVVAVGWLAWLTLQEGPRLSTRTRRWLTATGQGVVAGFGSLAFLTPYNAVQAPAPAEPRHS